MAETKDEDFDINLKDVDNNDLDALLAAPETEKTAPAATAEKNLLADDDDDDVLDFNDFSIDDLNMALSKYGTSDDEFDDRAEQKNGETSVAETDQAVDEIESLAGSEESSSLDDISAELPKEISLPEISADLPDNPIDVTDDNDNTPVSDETEKSAFSAEASAESDDDEEQEISGPGLTTGVAAVQSVSELQNLHPVQNPQMEKISSPAPADETGSVAGGYSRVVIDEEKLGNLRWYDATLGEKVYEISLINMPEFLDYDPKIKTIFVNIDSPYGWNVFFENGVFMNLMDLKEFQERHGYLPGTNGKIIYGSKTSSFERIERIVVYEKPRYFSYGLKE